MGTVKNIRHVGVVVDSLEKSIELYCSVLGFKEMPIQEERGHYLDKLLGVKNCVLKGVKLETYDGGSKLELLKFTNSSSIRKQNSSLFSTGITHFSLTVNDVWKTYNDLKNFDIEFISEPVKTDVGPQVFFCRDFNGVFLEIVEP